MVTKRWREDLNPGCLTLEPLLSTSMLHLYHFTDKEVEIALLPRGHPDHGLEQLKSTCACAILLIQGPWRGGGLWTYNVRCYIWGIYRFYGHFYGIFWGGLENLEFLKAPQTIVIMTRFGHYCPIVGLANKFHSWCYSWLISRLSRAVCWNC